MAKRCCLAFCTCCWGLFKSDVPWRGVSVEGRCGTGCHEKSPDRTNSPNGFRVRTSETRAASVELKIPRRRQASYFHEFLKPRRTAEKTLTAVFQEAHIRACPLAW